MNPMGVTDGTFSEEGDMVKTRGETTVSAVVGAHIGDEDEILRMVEVAHGDLERYVTIRWEIG